MKIIYLLVLTLVLCSQHASAQDSLCGAIKRIVNEVPSQFKSLKGELESEDGNTKYYALKLLPEGWAYGNYIVENKKVSLLLSAGADEGEEAGQLRFRSLSKELSACLSVNGRVDKDSFDNPVVRFKFKGATLLLQLTGIDGKSLTTLAIEITK